MLQLLLEHCDFLTTDISQGSVSTCLRCDGMFKYMFVANLPLSLPAKEFRKSVTFGEVVGKSLVSCFLTHGVHSRNKDESGIISVARLL